MPPESAAPYSRQNPYPAKLLVNRRLNPGSEKDTRHLELDLSGWGLGFTVGDSMAIYPCNDPALVEEILHALGASGNEVVPGSTKGQTLPLRDALSRDYRITQPTPKFLNAIAERASGAPLLNELLDPERKADLDNYLWGLEVIDFLLEHRSVHFTPEEFVGLLAKLQPRLYSIASSLKAFRSRSISPSTSCATKVMGGNAPASAPLFWQSARTNRGFRCSRPLRNSACRRTTTRP